MAEPTEDGPAIFLLSLVPLLGDYHSFGIHDFSVHDNAVGVDA